MSRPITPHPVNPARPRPLPSPRPNPPTPRPQPRPGHLARRRGVDRMTRRTQNALLLFALATLMPVGWLAILWGCARSLYWLPDSGEITDALLIWLLATWALVGLVLEPPRRPRRTDPRAPRSPEWDGVAVRPAAMVSAAERGLGSISGASARTSPAGGRAGHIPPSPTWRSA